MEQREILETGEVVINIDGADIKADDDVYRIEGLFSNSERMENAVQVKASYIGEVQ